MEANIRLECKSGEWREVSLREICFRGIPNGLLGPFEGFLIPTAL